MTSRRVDRKAVVQDLTDMARMADQKLRLLRFACRKSPANDLQRQRIAELEAWLRQANAMLAELGAPAASPVQGTTTKHT